VYFVTRGGQAAGAAPYDVAPAQAALWGFARSARLEHPELACVSVDLDPSGVRDNVSALADELTSRSHEDQVAYRGGSRLAARLVQGDGRALTDAPLAVPDAPSFRLSTTGRGVLDNLLLEPQERRQPGAGEVEIEVEAAGVNFRDVLNALGMYPGDPGPMGGECAGRVVSVGAGVTTLRVGDDVFCLAGGSFSRFVVAQERAVARRPAALTAVQASSLPLTFLTVYHGLHHLAGIKPGQRVLVHAAAGGVGLSAIQVARAAGAEVYGTAGSPEKQDYVRSLGVKAVFSSRTADFEAGLMAATGGEGVDIVLNSLTGEFIPASLRVLRKGGTFLEIGKAEIWTGAQLAAVNPDVHYKPFDLGDVILTDLDRIASMFKDVLAGLAMGALGPLPVRVFDMTDARSAFRFMAQARHFGKIVLRAPRLKPDAGAFAITGGSGGLGLRVAQRLAERGTRHLVLAGRSEPSAAVVAAVDEMRASGVSVGVVRADVGTADGVRAVLAAVDALGVRLSGIVHAAGVLDDGIIRDQTPERVDRVMSAKATGALLLDEMTRERSPEHFVLFSSVASLLGSPGQANYAAANAFLDGLAHRRHADGRPATSINWGAWAEIGMAARVHGGAARLEDSGFGTIAPDLGLTALDLAMSADVAQVGVFPASWDKVLARFASGSEPAFLRTLAKETAHRSTGSEAGDSGASLTSRLEAVPEAERNDLILAFVRQRVARVIGVENGDGLDPLVPFTNLGVDSLMAVEMRNALASSLGRQLPPSLIYDYPNISTLAAFVASELMGPSSSNQPAAKAPGADEADKWEEAASRLDELSEREMADLLAAQLGALGGGEDPAR
jgi:NADPH:quinone reductase-like Zn-dependent oxidoreductase/NADP-dependent 3-hydroxy acid dehydrogenase YdfG/acyl carrier protein